MQQTTDNDRPKGKGHIGASVMYLLIVGVVFGIMTVVFVFFPRTKYSELEKRDLAEFPDITDIESIKKNPGNFTASVSSWFSDTEPYRDEFMTLSMHIRGAMKGDFRDEEDAVSFLPADTGNPSATPSDDKHQEDLQLSEGEEGNGYNENDLDDGKAKIANSGIILIGKGENVRALMAFGGSPNGGGAYIDLLNKLADEFPGCKVYSVIPPTATEYYLPEKAASASKPQKPFIYSVRDRLSPKVKFVDVYDELLKHKDEDIYLRTDHHWGALGGYYAAKRLAEAAGVPFKGLDAYDRHEIKGFVGSMYGYSKDISVKNAPETFVYYTPNQVSYDTEFVTYTLDKDFKIVKESKPYKSSFFKKFNDGSGNAYLTFIGTDQAYVKVKTSTPGSRKLLIIKDSFGNAIPGHLFYSFNEVHVIDFRYFTHNLKDYISKNGITDIAICFNVFNAYSSGSAAKVKKMLSQKGGLQTSAESENKSDKDKEKDEKAQQETTKSANNAEEAKSPVEEEKSGENEQIQKEETPVTPEKTVVE